MNILFLSQIIPYPLDAGPKVKTWNVLRYLADHGHRITFVSFVRPDETAYLPEIKKLCHTVIPVAIHRSRILDLYYLLRCLIYGRSFLIERDDVSGMRAVVQRLLEDEKFDAVHADQITMTQFVLPLAHLPVDQRPALLFDAHNADWVILDRMAQTGSWFARPFLSREARCLKHYEGKLVRGFDWTLAVSEIDRRALVEAGDCAHGRAVQAENRESRPRGGKFDERVAVIPIAVDTRAIQPVQRRANSVNILTLGTLNYPPNADGIRWFIQEVFPLIRREIPEATLTIAGKKPPSDFTQLAEQQPHVYTVPGYVPDLLRLLEKAAVVVVPVRVGGGMRVRILEAFARAMPVITTTIGLEGIEAQPGRDVLVEDTPDKFAAAVVRVMEDPALQNMLSKNGRELVETCYDWQVSLQKLEWVYETIHNDRKGGVTG